MKLTESDRKYLKKTGHKKKEIDRIEVATSLTRYEYGGKLICDVTAAELLGREAYLSGIARSAFHWSAARKTPGGETVFFDSSALFQ